MHVASLISLSFLDRFCQLSFADTKRREFFHRHLENLSIAASQGYDALAASSKELQPLITSSYPHVPLLKDVSVLLNLKEDRHSKSLLPRDCVHLMPIKTVGDGNCLYRYMYNNLSLGNILNVECSSLGG